MALTLRLVVMLPLVLSLVSFVLASLALFAGSRQGFMEDYAIVRLNTSMIGQNIFKSSQSKDNDKSDDSGSSSSSGGGGLLGYINDKFHDIKDDVKDKVNNITADIVGDLADKLGVEDWYSLHIMNSCEGSFGDNATASHFQLNVTNCTTSNPSYRFNLTEVLDHELSIGPFDINLADIDWPSSIQDKIGDLNNSLLALFIFYVLGVGLSGLSMLFCIPALLIPGHKLIALANLATASLGAFSIAIGSIIVTAASSIAAKAINKAGSRVSVVAETGTKFNTISWIAAIFMTISALFWGAQFLLIARKLKKQQTYLKQAQ